MKEGTIPSSLKSSIIPPIHKGGSKAEPANYRKYLVTGTALSLAFGVFYKRSITAKAKEYESNETAIADNISQSYEPTPDLPSMEDTRYAKWATVQQRYLLLSETQRKNIQLRDITKEEFEDVDRMYEENHFTQCEDKLIEINTLSPHNDEVITCY